MRALLPRCRQTWRSSSVVPVSFARAAHRASTSAMSGGAGGCAAAAATEWDRVRFLFDLNGFVVARGALSPDHVAALNAAVDRHAGEFKARSADRPVLRNTADGTPLAGDGRTPREDLGGMLGWPRGDREPFRELLAHPTLSRYVELFCGAGYRLDHSPLVIRQRAGSEGFQLHGGPLTRAGRMNPSLEYVCRPPDVWTSLVAMSVTLAPQPDGAGGFVVVRGSHKMNFPLPDGLAHGAELTEHLHQPATEPGDVIFFSEATVHGAAPWRAEHERRIALLRFAPAERSYGRAGAAPGWPESYLDGCTPAQRAVLEPAYSVRLDRPVLVVGDDNSEGGVGGGSGEGAGAAAVGVEVCSRSAEKKTFDKEVFGTEYF